MLEKPSNIAPEQMPENTDNGLHSPDEAYLTPEEIKELQLAVMYDED